MSLSNGERQRLMIGLAIATNQDLIILDEGLSALDEEALIAAFEVLNYTDIPLLFISHQRDAQQHLLNKTLQEITLTPYLET